MSLWAVVEVIAAALPASNTTTLGPVPISKPALVCRWASAESVTGAETGGGAGTGADATVVGGVASVATAAGDVPSGMAR